MPREVQVSSLPTNHFPTHEKHSGNILLSKCALSWPCRQSLGFSTLGIENLITEYLSLGKPSLARAVLNQFIIPRGRYLKKRTTRCHHCESRALRVHPEKRHHNHVSAYSCQLPAQGLIIPFQYLIFS